MSILKREIMNIFSICGDINRRTNHQLKLTCYLNVYLIFFIIIATLLIILGFKRYILNETFTICLACFWMLLNTYVVFKISKLIKLLSLDEIPDNEQRLP